MMLSELVLLMLLLMLLMLLLLLLLLLLMLLMLLQNLLLLELLQLRRLRRLRLLSLQRRRVEVRRRAQQRCATKAAKLHVDKLVVDANRIRHHDDATVDRTAAPMTRVSRQSSRRHIYYLTFGPATLATNHPLTSAARVVAAAAAAVVAAVAAIGRLERHATCQQRSQSVPSLSSASASKQQRRRQLEPELEPEPELELELVAARQRRRQRLVLVLVPVLELELELEPVLELVRRRRQQQPQPQQQHEPLLAAALQPRDAPRPCCASKSRQTSARRACPALTAALQ